MAYDTSNPPFLICEGIGGTNNRRVWMYVSTDAAADVNTSGYFSDGYDLGMRTGDVVLQIDSDASPIDLTIMAVASATTTAVDVTDGTEVAGADSD